MNRICEIPKITENPEVLFHEKENPAGAKIYQKQEEAVKKAWRRIISKKFDAIEIFALDDLPFGERKDVHILTHSLRNPEKIQMTVISNQDGFPSYHIEYRLSRLIPELAVFSAHHPHVYAEILSYPDQEDYRKAFDLCRKYSKKRNGLQKEIISVLRKLNLVQAALPYPEGIERCLVYHKEGSMYPEGWYADPIRNMEDDLLDDDQNYLIKKILAQIPDELLGQLVKERYLYNERRFS